MPHLRHASITTLALAISGSVLAACGGSSFEDSPQATGGGGSGGAGGGGSVGGSSGIAFNPGGFTLPVAPDPTAVADAGMIGADAGVTITPEPPAAGVIDGCAALCDKQAQVSCPVTQSVADCRAGCSLILADPLCASAARALFSCSESAIAVCGADGKPTLQGCEGQLVTAAGCFLQNATDPAMSAPCTTYCAKVKAAGCTGDGTEAECSFACGIMGNLYTGCGPGWDAYVNCANGATLSCGSDGRATAPTCLSQAVSFIGCVLTLYGEVTAPRDAGA